MCQHVDIASYDETIAALHTFSAAVTEGAQVMGTGAQTLVEAMSEDKPSLKIAQKVGKLSQGLTKISEYAEAVAAAMQRERDRAEEYLRRADADYGDD